MKHPSLNRAIRYLCLAFALLAGLRANLVAAPLRALLITGGCCHDYSHQKDILKKGLEERANVLITQIHTDDTSTKPPLAILGKSDYAKGYDVVIHDECASEISDPARIEAVLAPHRQGVPGVNLHCAMHSYRIGNPNEPAKLGTQRSFWFEYLGLQSSAHGPQEPIFIHFTDSSGPITKGLTDWSTVKEELYNNIQVFDSSQVLARGKQTFQQKEGGEKSNEFVVVWLNQYGPKKTRIFSTTIGHNSATVADPRYLDLVARGLLWATGHLSKDGSPAKGFGSSGN